MTMRSVCSVKPSIPFWWVSLMVVYLVGCLHSFGQQLGTPVPFTHSHNDYLREIPLWTALRQGITSIEVDLYYRRGRLMVAHLPWQILKHRTFEAMYLRPLDSIVAANGNVYPGYPFFTLWIDFKECPKRLIAPLRHVLSRYPRLWPRHCDSGQARMPISLVLTGKRPNQTILDADSCLCFAIADTQTRKPPPPQSAVYSKPLYNFSFTSVLGRFHSRTGWTPKQLYVLANILKSAQETGTRVRVYRSPEDERVWKVFRELGVAFISTDNPARLIRFLQQPRGLWNMDTLAHFLDSFAIPFWCQSVHP